MEKIENSITQEIAEYLKVNGTQADIQEARSEIRHYRLGRAPRNDRELQQARYIQMADKILKQALSDTLEGNRKSQRYARRGARPL